MKKTQKKILGFSGLLLVAAMTVFAAYLPVPEASATTALTDVIKVRVVGAVPDVNINNINYGEIFTSTGHAFGIDYENAENVKVTLQYTNVAGEVTTDVLAETYSDYYTGSYNVYFVKE
ncbi:hypothetical protein IJF93_01585 [Candidatus Saccharibacteria bacterium]|nr:hypothetical protein [Candidatus Saccharibacteria bacterium]